MGKQQREAIGSFTISVTDFVRTRSGQIVFTEWPVLGVLTEDEKLLVTEGVELHQALIEKLQDVPTPAGPTPRELEASRKLEQKVIPLRWVQRAKKQYQDQR